uniref:Uncharacterized protein n=1 Tax=Strombidium inclinatum TaxID=197538 RepID=A0A7S3IMW8_9SPIT|mmetsp:Transcript_26904/g.40996  ORF Transcript_26904/g.40996 Transcript_26904/m.40996 type:complete len:102 (+) Transcript_26904:1968-2273(+)
MGQAVLDGNLKRKTFGKGLYYVVNQTNLGNSPYNILEKYKSLAEAKAQYDKTEQGSFSKILVDGTSGKVVEQAGEASWVAQNLMYMYEHVQGKVFNGRFRV